VAVVGGGNGSYTFAADVALAGHRVRFWPGARHKHAAVFDSAAIEVSGCGAAGRAELDMVSEDVADVVREADIIVATDPAFSQESRAELLAPYLEPEQVVFLSPGSLGSVAMARMVRAKRRPPECLFAEPATLRYLTRKCGAAAVHVSARALVLPVGVFPARRTERALEKLKSVFPEACAVENVLSAALLNVGPVLHSALMLLNTGAIEHFERWDIHNEGTTPSVKRLILAQDEERVVLRQALGFAPPHYPLRDHYDPSPGNEWLYGRQGHSELVQSGQWREHLGLQHRYIQEDAKINLALFCSISRLCGTSTPIADGILTLLGALLGEDLLRTGRTMESLGLSRYSSSELSLLLERGFGA
jgi:opine dehydrogenase